MSNSAIIVAIIPPKEVVDLAIKINSEARQKGFHADPLGINDFIPHITLFMGVVKNDNLVKLASALDKLLLKKHPFKLEIIGIKDSEHSPDENSYFEIKNTKDLQKLHNEVCENLSPFLEPLASEGCLFGDKEISDNTKKWLENYVLMSAYEKFNPHITLRCKNSRSPRYSAKFNASQIVLFHAGNHATCRKMLWGHVLK